MNTALLAFIENGLIDIYLSLNILKFLTRYKSMPRLTKTERETIIIKYLKGQKTPGYEVIECNNGKYQVREKKLQVEVEEDEDESIDEQTIDEDSNGREDFQSESIDEQSEEERTEEKPKPKPKKTHKQNARKLLAQLQELMSNEQDETSEDYSEEQTDNGIYYNGASNEPRRVTWERRRLRLM